MSEIKTHESVAGLEACHEDSHIGLGTRVGLHIGILGSEKLFQTVLSKCFSLINHLAAAIVAVTGVSFGILVGQTGAHGLHHLGRNEVLAGDEFNALLLTLMFTVDNVENDVVALHIGNYTIGDYFFLTENPKLPMKRPCSKYWPWE